MAACKNALFFLLFLETQNGTADHSAFWLCYIAARRRCQLQTVTA